MRQKCKEIISPKKPETIILVHMSAADEHPMDTSWILDIVPCFIYLFCQSYEMHTTTADRPDNGTSTPAIFFVNAIIPEDTL